MSDESKLCARLIVAKQPPAMRNLSVQWVDGLRGSVTKRRDTAAKFLAQLKNQSGDYAKAHHAVIAECDKMLSANEMAEMLRGKVLAALRQPQAMDIEGVCEDVEELLRKAGVL
jgi:hypothetical protein